MPDLSAHDVSPTLSESAKIKNLSVIINGKELRPNNIDDLEIVFGVGGKTGHITFLDVDNLNELGALIQGDIIISYTDSLGASYKEVFAIVQSKNARNKSSGITIQLQFESYITYTLKQTYLSLGFKNKTIGEVFDEIMKKLELPVDIVEKEDSHKFEGIVIPKSISLYDWMNTKMSLMNMVLIDTKKETSIVSKDLLDFSKLDEPQERDFIQGFKGDRPFHSILEFNGDISSRQKLNQAPPTQIEYIKDNVLSLVTEVVSLETAYASQKLNGGAGVNGANIVNTSAFIGQKTGSPLGINKRQGLDYDYRDAINESQDVYMIVQGTNFDRLYTKVKVSLHRTVDIKGGGKDETFSGIFVVTRFVDKITSGIFYQKLVLQRSDFGEGDPNVK